MVVSSVLMAHRESSEDDRPAYALPLFSLLTFFPMGNPLEFMTRMQRQFFFESIFRMLHLQRVEDNKRVGELMGKLLPPVAGATALLAAVSMRKSGKAARAKAEEERKEEEEKKEGAGRESKKGSGEYEGYPPGAGPSSPAGMMPMQSVQAQRPSQGQFSSFIPKPFGLGAAASLAGTDMAFQKVYGEDWREARESATRLALEIDDYARGDDKKAQSVLSAFQSQAESGGYKAQDLMALLLLIIEDSIWAPQEGFLGQAGTAGSAVRLAQLPAAMRQSAKESAYMRLASVREMLRYYFERNPQDYASALAAALGITADQEGDDEFLQERLAYELARVGSFALAQKILAAARQRRKMDEKKCLLELGYHYDARRRELVVGKRTCLRHDQARGMLGLLLAGMKNPKKE